VRPQSSVEGVPVTAAKRPLFHRHDVRVRKGDMDQADYERAVAAAREHSAETANKR